MCIEYNASKGEADDEHEGRSFPGGRKNPPEEHTRSSLHLAQEHLHRESEDNMIPRPVVSINKNSTNIFKKYTNILLTPVLYQSGHRDRFGWLQQRALFVQEQHDGVPSSEHAARRPRTAVCVVGQARTLYSSTQLEALSRQLEALRPRDVFLVLAAQPGLEEKLRAASEQNLTVGFRFVTKAEIERVLVGGGGGNAPANSEDVVEKINKDRVFWYTGTEYTTTPRGSCTNAGEGSLASKRYYDWQAVYWPLQHCLRLIESEEQRQRKKTSTAAFSAASGKERGSYYQYVAKLRPDAQLAYPLRIADFPALAPPPSAASSLGLGGATSTGHEDDSTRKIVVANAFSYSSACVFCDHWALMTRAAADSFFTISKAYENCDLLESDPEGKTCQELSSSKRRRGSTSSPTSDKQDIKDEISTPAASLCPGGPFKPEVHLKSLE